MLVKNKSFFLKSIFIIFILLLISANVFAISTKNTATAADRTGALASIPKNITNIEIKGASVALNSNSECVVNITFKEPIPVKSNNSNQHFYPHFLISIPLKDKGEYPRKMSDFIVDHSNNERTKTYLNNNNQAYMYLIKKTTFSNSYSLVLPANVAKNFCNNPENSQLDVYVFVPTTSGLGLFNSVYFHYKPINNKYITVFHRHEDIGGSSHQFSMVGLYGNLYKPTDSTGKFIIEYFYNVDYAYGVSVKTKVIEDTKCKTLNDELGSKGYKFIPNSSDWFHARLYNEDPHYVCVSCMPNNPQMQFVAYNPKNKTDYAVYDWEDYSYNNYPKDLISKFRTEMGCFDSKKSQTITAAPTNLTCETHCFGYEKSKNYPSGLVIGNTRYDAGALCYKCNADGTTAERCDPATGKKLGTANLNKALKNEICPEIEINIELPDISSEIDKELKELIANNPPILEYNKQELQTFGEIQTTTNVLFDCSVQKTTLSERKKVKYNNNNARYSSSEGIVTLNYLSNNIDITISDSFLKRTYNFLQTKDYATACLLIPVDAEELREANRYIKEGESGIITNGNVISTVKVLPGKKLELCINRPVTILSDSERVIQNKTYLDNKNKKKIFAIKQNKKWWFDKKIQEFTITLNATLEPLGCIDRSAATVSDTPKFVSKIGTTGSCYNPQGTELIGLTGEENYKKYGFDKLFLIYDEEAIFHNNFDYGQYYVDQDQLKVALFNKAKIIEEKQTIALDGITFKKTEDNKIAENWLLYLSDMKTNIAKKLITSDFIYSEDPDQYLNTLIAAMENVPEDLRKFIILDFKIDTKSDTMFNTYYVEDKEIKERVDKLSGNSNLNYLTEKLPVEYYPEAKTHVVYYQMTLDSFIKNQKIFKEYINSKPTDSNFKIKNIIFLKQFIETVDVYYGDAVSHALINTKTFGPLNSGLTKEIFSSVKFMSYTNKPVELATDSEVKEINAPGLYLFEIQTDGSKIKYLVKNTTTETKKYLDYYNMPEHADYKKNILLTTPLNATYFDYTKVPFGKKSNNFGDGAPIKPTVYEGYEKWSEVQDGYIFSMITNGSNIEKMYFKDIRPIQIYASQSYSYKYLKPNNSYSNTMSKESGKDTIFVFLNHGKRDPQLVLTSSQELNLNWAVTPEIKDGVYTYNIPNSIQSKEDSELIYSDMFSGIETNNVGFTVSLITKDRTCFNSIGNSFQIWLNPEYTIKTNN